MAKPYWFKFFPDWWLSSKDVNLMTLKEQGAYLRLLCMSYPDGLPDEDDKLARLSGLNEGWFNGSSEIIKPCFKKIRKRLYHPILKSEHENYMNWVEKSREGGIASGKARKQKNISSKGGSTVVEGYLNEKSRVEKSTKRERKENARAQRLRKNEEAAREAKHD